MDCNDCENYEFVGTKHENSVCAYCKLHKAKKKILDDIKQLSPYRLLVKVLDWTEEKLS